MRKGALRLYLLGVTFVAFFVLWATVAAKPWTAASAATKPARDPRLKALDRWERRLHREARAIDRTLARRWRDYRRRLRVREHEIAATRRRYAQELAAARASASRAAPAATSYAAAPSTQVVSLPPKVTVVTLPPAAAPATSSGSSHP
jgi:hypothetical protein